MSDAEQTNKVEYQTYRSTLTSHKMVTPGGKVLQVIGNQFVTNNEDDIAFLDAEIKAGFPYLTKGDVVTSEELDPMVALRKKIIAEYLASEAAELGGQPDASTSDTPTLTPVSSEKVAAQPTAVQAALAKAAAAKAAKDAE